MIILAHVVFEKHQGGQPPWEHGGGGEVLGVGDSARHGLLVHHEAPSHACVDLCWVLQQPQQVKVFVKL